MDIKEERICRLCLNISENEYEVIDKTIKEMLGDLSIKMNMDITKDPMMCKTCSKTVNRSYMFKLTCDETNERFVKSEASFELKKSYEDNEGAGAVNEDFSTCELCKNQMGSNDSVTRGVIMNDSKIAEMLPDIDNINNRVICALCRENSEQFSNFALNCLNTEEKINTYCQHEGINGAGQVELNRVLQFFDEYTEIVTEQKPYKSEDTQIGNSEIHEKLIKTEVLDIKDETNLDENPLEQSDKVTLMANKRKCSLCTYSTNHKSSFDRHLLIHKDCSEVQMYNCALCTYMTKFKTRLTVHMLTHKDVSEAKMHKCTKCNWMSKHTSSLNRHMLTHKSISKLETHKCPMCSFESIHKTYLTRHMVTHKHASEVKLYKCAECTFETKYRKSCRNHLLTHKDRTEIEMYKCTMCPYQVKHKSYINRHMLVHLDSSKVKMHKCTMCTFETKRGDTLKVHMLNHKDIAEVEMHKCTMCTYETKHKKFLTRHTLLHRDLPEELMHNCTLCDFKTKYKRSLVGHMSTHNSVSESKMYKCTICAFKTKYKRNLAKHLVRHNSEVKVYKCSSCTFKSKHKQGLRSHTLVHKTLENEKIEIMESVGQNIKK